MIVTRCPVCGERELRAEDYMTPMGLHYRVACYSCGIVMTHEDFHGINAVEAFLEGAQPLCENEAPMAEEGEQVEWKCSICGKERRCAEGEPAYAHCPDCGAEVVAW